MELQARKEEEEREIMAEEERQRELKAAERKKMQQLAKKFALAIEGSVGVIIPPEVRPLA